MPFVKHDEDSVKRYGRNLTKGCKELESTSAENTRTWISNPDWRNIKALDFIDFGSKICSVQNGAARRVIRTYNIKYVA